MLREWLVWLATCQSGGEPGRGCLVVNTATELGAGDVEVYRRIEASFEVTQEALRSLLQQGRRGGQLPAERDIEVAAELPTGLPRARPRPRMRPSMVVAATWLVLPPQSAPSTSAVSTR